MKLLINHPLSWKTTISFLSLATLLILLISWLTISGALPIKMAMEPGIAQDLITRGILEERIVLAFLPEQQFATTK